MNKPKCKLIGENGNIFNLLCIARKVLLKNNLVYEALNMQNEVFNAKSYEEALMILDKYVEIE